ncbi:hypothetical protein HDK77DRAFT_4756 [Phyllosticta capitalensis]
MVVGCLRSFDDTACPLHRFLGRNAVALGRARSFLLSFLIYHGRIVSMDAPSFPSSSHTDPTNKPFHLPLDTSLKTERCKRTDGRTDGPAWAASWAQRADTNLPFFPSFLSSFLPKLPFFPPLPKNLDSEAKKFHRSPISILRTALNLGKNLPRDVCELDQGCVRRRSLPSCLPHHTTENSGLSSIERRERPQNRTSHPVIPSARHIFRRGRWGEGVPWVGPTAGRCLRSVCLSVCL